MTGLLPCACADTCQADPRCHHTPRFQLRLDAPHMRNKACCASHLGTMAQAMTTWARDHGLTEGDLTILTMDPPPGGQCRWLQPPSGGAPASGLVFSTIPLET